MTVQPWEPSGIIAECVAPEPQDIRHALDKKQVLWRWKNSDIQVLAQTLSNYLDTRTSSLLAVNKKQGVPRKFIHREWKRTWVNLDGLKERVAHTEHGSALLKGLKQVIQAIDLVTTPDDSRVRLSSVEQKKQEAKLKKQAKPGTRQNPLDPCEVADEASKLSKHNTERLDKLDRDMGALENIWFSTRAAVSTDLGTQSKRLDMLADRIHRIEAGDKQATEAMAEKRTPFDALSQRVGGLVTHVDRLDAKTEGLTSRVSVLEDTSKWLSWTLAGVIGLRFLGLMFHWLKRK